MVPGEPMREDAETPPSERIPSEPPPPVLWGPPRSTVERLAPWVDLDRIGPTEFYRWLEAVAPLLPRPDRAPPPAQDLEGRVAELAHALVESAQAEARAHFQASEYFRDNVLLARRTRALEAMVRTAGLPLPPGSRDGEAAADRYLPRRRDP